MEEKEVMLVGFDIRIFVKSLCEKLLVESPDMTEGEKKAYKLGIDNTLSLLEQTLSEGIQAGGECYDNIAVHVPNLECIEEFLTIEDIVEKLNKGSDS